MRCVFPELGRNKYSREDGEDRPLRRLLGDSAVFRGFTAFKSLLNFHNYLGVYFFNLCNFNFLT